MPLRQTIGISLALMMISAGAIAKTPEKSTSYQPAPTPNAEPKKSTNRSGKARALHRSAHARSPSRVAARHGGRSHLRHAVAYRSDDGGGPPDRYWGQAHAIGSPEIGQAAWYSLVGGRTSSGERLDTITPTAAHRSLPLGSCAKVTDLDTGRSVIVKINDRGPYNRHFIIDLSPRAAEELGIRHEGVAAVAVEPVAIEPALNTAVRPTLAAYRGSAAGAAQ